MSAVFKAHGLSSTEKLVLLAIADHASAEGTCFPSYRTIEEKTALSRRTVMAIMKGLEKRGLLERSKRMRADGSHTSNEITMNLDAISALSAREGVQETAKGRDSPAPLEPRTNHHIEPRAREANLWADEAAPPISTDSAESAFESFWRTYPRKAGKGGAKKAFGRAWPKLKGNPPDGRGKLGVLLLAIERQGLAKKEQRFIPHPATWLNDERWLDEEASALGPGGQADWC